jgi:molecular chaperone GrpE
MSEVSMSSRSTGYVDHEVFKNEQVPPMKETVASFFAGTEAVPGAEKMPSVEMESIEKWRDRALHLQAEMENFRRQQRRRAEARVALEREGLLRAFTHLADNLERALTGKQNDVRALHSGVELTHHAFMQFLEREGVIPVDPAGKRFDPELHEAVGTIPQQDSGVNAETVVEVLERGYLIGGRLLRPAQVIVAV